MPDQAAGSTHADAVADAPSAAAQPNSNAKPEANKASDAKTEQVAAVEAPKDAKSVNAEDKKPQSTKLDEAPKDVKPANTEDKKTEPTKLGEVSKDAKPDNVEDKKPPTNVDEPKKASDVKTDQEAVVEAPKDVKPANVEDKKPQLTNVNVASKDAKPDNAEDKSPTNADEAKKASDTKTNQVASLPTSRSSRIESIKSKLADKKASSKVGDLNASDEVKAEVMAIQKLPGAQVTYDEYNMERQGFLFKRIALASTTRSYIYPVQLMTKVPIVVKVTLLDCCNPRTKENLIKNAARILRFVGGNGDPPPHSTFPRVYNIFRIDLKVYTFMDEVGDQSLLDMIKSRTKFSQEEARRTLKSLFDAVQFLQKRSIAHRDIKIDHVHFDKQNNPKLLGWNRAVFFWDPVKDKILKQKREAKAFTNCHMPPEAFDGSYHPGQADVWSLGVILAALHTRRHVYKPKSKVNYGKQWTDFVAKHRLAPLVRELLDAIFIVDPSQRTSVGELLHHKYWQASAADIEQPKKPAKSNSKATGGKMDEESIAKIEGGPSVDTLSQVPKPVQANDVPLEEAPGSEVPDEVDA